MAIEKLNQHYSFTNPASVYDEEALTALELAGRQGAKINEVVEDQNALRKETNDHLNDQDKLIEKRFNDQDQNIKDRCDKQDQAIAKMNDVTMPAKVVSEVQAHIDQGTFDQQIDESLDHLNKRVDQLLGSLETGSTTGDAELMDIRIGADGKVYENAGESVREQLKGISKTVEIKLDFLFGKTLADTTNGWKNTSNWALSFPYPVKKGEKITIKGRVPSYAFLDEKLNPISGSIVTVFTLTDPIDEVPEQYEVIPPVDGFIKITIVFLESNQYYQNPENVRIIYGKAPILLDQNSVGYNELSHGVIDKKHFGAKVLAKASELDLEQNRLVQNDSEGNYEIVANGSYHLSPFIPIKGGTEYWIRHGYDACGYFYDENKNPLCLLSGRLMAYPIPESKIVDFGKFITPLKAKYVRFNTNVAHVETQCIGYGDLILTDEEIETASGFVTLDYLSIPSDPSNESEWKGKKFVSLGDSITWQDGKEYASTGETARGYQTIIKEKLGFADYLNKGVSGAPVADGTANGNGTVTTAESVNYASYDLCIIAGGTNDFKLNVPLGAISEGDFNRGTFFGAYQTMIENILTQKPNIRICLFTPIHRNNGGYSTTSTNTAGHKLIDYVNAIRELGERYSLPVCDLYANSGITKLNLSLYTLDGLHPNDEGYIRMGVYSANFINNIGG